MKRWVVVRCWQGNHSTLVPSPTKIRTFTRRAAERMAGRMSLASRNGCWFEVRSLRESCDAGD